MQNFALGDVIFIILVLGLIHGILYLIMLARQRKAQEKD
jgi:preprotein translocase subunit YajC